MVFPMMYTDQVTGDPESIETEFKADNMYFTGGPEGIIPLVGFLTTGISSPVDVSVFKQEVDKLRELGADGWIIWRYGGPGVDDNGYQIDIRPYLDLLDMPDVFSIRDIQVSVSATQTTITWETDLPATSKVEYSTSPLFTATKKVSGDRYYWDVDYVGGIVIEDPNQLTSHSITLTGLEPGQRYYFRIQSQNENGTATSKMVTFDVSA
jgi:hypothetical protein